MRRIAVRAIVLYQNKVLCVNLKPYNEFVKDINGAWCLPGGGLDEGESLVDGLKRELLEETGIQAKVGQLLYVQQFKSDTTDVLEFFFSISNAKDFLDIDLSKTSHGSKEIAQIDFVDPKQTQILPNFLMTEDLVEKAESNSPPTIYSYIN